MAGARLTDGELMVDGMASRFVPAINHQLIRHQPRPGHQPSTLHQSTARVASRMISLNLSSPWSKAAEIGSRRVFRTLRLNFFKFSGATGSSILFATTRRGFLSR